MRDVEHIYMNVPRWTGRNIEEGTPWLDAAAELESILSQLDSLLGEFGGIGFSSQMGTLSSVTDGINAMRDARKYLHEEIVRIVDKPLEECFSRAVEALSAIDFDEICVGNKAGLVVNNAEVGGTGIASRKVNEYSLSDVLKGNVPELNGCVGYNQKIDGFREILEEMGGFTLTALQAKSSETDDEKTKDKKSFWEEIGNSIENFFAYPNFGRANDPTGNPPLESVLEYVGNITMDILERSKDKLNMSDILEKIYKDDELTDVHENNDNEDTQEVSSQNHIVKYIEYDITLEEFVNIQMNPKYPPIKVTQNGNVKAEPEEVCNACNPNNYMDDKYIYQFLVLNESSGLSGEDINRYLEEKGILEGKGECYIRAAKDNNINEIYLLCHSVLETGNGTSELANGVEINGVVVYNMYGIGAVDGSAIEEGAEFAYEHGWTTPEVAIEEGAKWIADRYTNNDAYEQNTLYEMRWNPQNPGQHQYATDINWAINQTGNMKLVFEEFPNAKLSFEIPIFKEEVQENQVEEN